MKRKIALAGLVGFLAYTGSYIFVYLWRAFRVDLDRSPDAVVIWHGDPFARSILVAVLFLIGLVVLVYVSLSRQHGARAGTVRLRDDLWEWLEHEADETNDRPERVAERAVAAYRSRLEGSRGP
ncbi:MAG: hypothetical protein HY658_08160 [Actinobacteria bacterium]|nr:hypothetical protein [Actinomycetota bacterium]